MTLPDIAMDLDEGHVSLLKTLSRSCRRTIISMLKKSQSGHPGGSLSAIDYLVLLYAGIIGKTGEKVVVSNGHISPAVYSIFAEMGWVKKDEVIEKFRQIGSIFEGHVNRHVPGVFYGTGPLGAGVSAAAGAAHATLAQGKKDKVYAVMGDGEAQEGQVYEMIHYAKKYKLSNLILFVDYNRVQLSGSLDEIMPIDIPAEFSVGGWRVIETDGHDFRKMWGALREAQDETEKPVVIIGYTIMGKGVPLMEKDGMVFKSTWHGKAPTPAEADEALKGLELTDEENGALELFRSTVGWTPENPVFPDDLSSVDIDTGTPLLYGPNDNTDCRTAYGKALLDLARVNKNIFAFTADLADSVKTSIMKKEFPERHFDAGIAEQHMVSSAGGFSLSGFVPFTSTFGVFASSRAKDQARVNDINRTNVKMVSTHSGLSVGEDGPTHQAIDDMGSFLGFFHTYVIEPADPNHCDRIIRYIASHYGNFYVRMGRHKVPVLTTEKGGIFYGDDYVYEFGKCDLYRQGLDITLIASGSLVHEAVSAREQLHQIGTSVELVIASSPQKFDETLLDSVKKTKKVVVVEDHHYRTGFGSQLARFLMRKGIRVDRFDTMGVTEYQLSGTSEELYKSAKLSAESIVSKVLDIVR